MIRPPPRSTLFPTTPLFRSRVVLARPDRLAEVLADLRGVDVEGRRELDVADVVAAEVDVHEPRHRLRRVGRSEEHTSELQSRQYIVCRLLLEKKNNNIATAN